ncbi:MAG: hypothetical protein S4CHLAM81_04020 [Chlamydiales bacterium]|nr:hypothetical protein [Chlamydiales bacterium]MCH9635191.1 hypothetical protein [Chlamydiales bacterium]MCH9704271.1 flagellar biosynthetic protein FliO [Chlamydiota bacterium]
MFLQLLAQEPSLLELATDFSEQKSYNYWGEFVNMIITLMIIVALIFISVIVLKKVMQNRMHQVNRGAHIKILERRSINQKSSLYLVDIAGKRVMIGESPAGLNLITELPDLEIEEEEEPVAVTSKLRSLIRRNG